MKTVQLQRHMTESERGGLKESMKISLIVPICLRFAMNSLTFTPRSSSTDNLSEVFLARIIFRPLHDTETV